MAEICCDVVGESKTEASCDPSSRAARRRRMDIRRCKFVASETMQPVSPLKRQKLEVYPALSPRDCMNTVESRALNGVELASEPADRGLETKENLSLNSCLTTPIPILHQSQPTVPVVPELVDQCPKFGMASLCGRRRDMEDAVAMHPSFCSQDPQFPEELHFYGIYDGHGCSHVAKSCRDRMHQLVKEEIENHEGSTEWKDAMERSFSRMDEEVLGRNEGVVLNANCRCELQTPECDAVGSTAVVAIVNSDKIVVANCGDSRAVLCRNGKAVPLSSDHKPDRLDELIRIQNAGGRVIYWDGPRVLGVLAMSRAIGDNYLKPFVISEPEVTITGRTPEDDCLILASDGLWDVVSNEMACGIARMCLEGQAPLPPLSSVGNNGRMDPVGERSDKACSDAAMLLAKLALARHSTDNVSVVVIDLRQGNVR